MDELKLLKIFRDSSSTAGCRRCSTSFHTTMARKKEGKQQEAAATPEKDQEPLIEEGLTRFVGVAQPPTR
jgi:hypothetical protein